MAVASGRLRICSYTDKDGNKRRVAEWISILKHIIDKASYELAARVELRDKNTGKEFR
jgi:hypothetical protein